jgi:hypothetical protein
MSYLIKIDSSTLTGVNSANYSTNFSTTLKLDGKYEIALVRANIWYSWYNISSEYNNTVFKYSTPNIFNYKSIIIPSGNYSIEDLNFYIQSQLEKNGDWDSVNQKHYITISPNYNTGKVEITVSNNYVITLMDNDLNITLGFEKLILVNNLGPAEKVFTGSKVADITNGINSIMIHCDLVVDSFENGVSGDVVWSFTPNSAPSTNLDIEPLQRIYLPIKTNNIQKITMKITDQKNRVLNLNGEPTTYLLHLKKVE